MTSEREGLELFEWYGDDAPSVERERRRRDFWAQMDALSEKQVRALLEAGQGFPWSEQLRRWSLQMTFEWSPEMVEQLQDLLNAQSEEQVPERLELARSERFLLATAVRLLSQSERARYLEEFRAELLDLPRDTRLSHALSLLRGAFVMRLRRGLKKKAADAPVRRAKG